MRGLERAVEWLRPLVDAKQQAWNYCVVWKFSDDPLRLYIYIYISVALLSVFHFFLFFS